MIRIITIYHIIAFVFTALLISACNQKQNYKSLDFTSAESFFLGKNLTQLRANHPDYTFKFYEGLGYHLLSGDSVENFMLVCDEKNDTIVSYEIQGNNYCFQDICIGSPLSVVQQAYPNIPVELSADRMKEFFTLKKATIEVQINIKSNIMNQVVGNYSQENPARTSSYSSEGTIAGILIKKTDHSID
ncbi:MAG: hypothetical protein HQK83_17530 [Fibrobacteria bacterium]|nr:hypothetical protein [Fibrobacteria bacterium]